MNRSRHRMVSIDLDGRRMPIAHVVTDAQVEYLVRVLRTDLRVQVDDCSCATPLDLSADCAGETCGMCIGFLEGAVTVCACACHSRREEDRLRPEDVPPNAAYLERWITHWQDRALKAEARLVGVHAQAVDARRRELAAETRWRDCAVHAATITEYQTMLDRLNDVIEPYEQLRVAVVMLRHELGEAHGKAVDVAAVAKHLGKLVDACNRGLEKASARSRAREEPA